jgi:hypothetical protein
MTLDEFAIIANAIHPPMMWLLVVLGWMVVSRQSDGREARKELRAQIDELIRRINAVLDEATTFYMAAGSEPTADRMRASLLRSLSIISSSASELSGGDMDKPLVDKAVLLRQSITLHGFDDRDRAPLTYSDQKLFEIRNAVQDLISCLERAFAKRYSSTRQSLF